MSDQEMQFADPDWKPTRPLDKNKAQQEQEVYTPQPINVEPQEQQKWQTAAPSHDYQEGYTGSGPQIPPAEKIGYAGANSYRDTGSHNIDAGQFKQPRARRRGRSSWFWIIIALIILGLMSGGFRSAFGGRDSPFRGFGPQNSVTETRTFTVSNNQPTIIINDSSGNIQVRTGDSSGNVDVQAIKQVDGFGNPKNEQVSYNRSLDGSTLTINFNDGGGSVDFNVTVPNNVNVQLKTSSGNVDVEGVSGQILMTTGRGNITATNDIFTGSTTLSTGSGDITFDGGITGTGDYQFTTGNGEIDANLTSGTALDINASTDNGSINSQVSTVSVQNNDPGATASGHIGSPNNSTRLTLKTGEGSINLNSTP